MSVDFKRVRDFDNRGDFTGKKFRDDALNISSDQVTKTSQTAQSTLTKPPTRKFDRKNLFGILPIPDRSAFVPTTVSEIMRDYPLAPRKQPPIDFRRIAPKPQKLVF